jgi:hypothetical protein
VSPLPLPSFYKHAGSDSCTQCRSGITAAAAATAIAAAAGQELRALVHDTPRAATAFPLVCLTCLLIIFVIMAATAWRLWISSASQRTYRRETMCWAGDGVRVITIKLVFFFLELFIYDTLLVITHRLRREHTGLVEL